MSNKKARNAQIFMTNLCVCTFLKKKYMKILTSYKPEDKI